MLSPLRGMALHTKQINIEEQLLKFKVTKVRSEKMLKFEQKTLTVCLDWKQSEWLDGDSTAFCRSRREVKNVADESWNSQIKEEQQPENFERQRQLVTGKLLL